MLKKTKIEKILDNNLHPAGNEKNDYLSKSARDFLFHLTTKNSPYEFNKRILVDYDRWEIIMEKKRTTIQNSIRELVEKGFLDRHHGMGPSTKKIIPNWVYVSLKERT